MRKMKPSLVLAAAFLLFAVILSGEARAAAIKTEVVKSGNGFQLMRGGKPFLIKGGGGGGPKPLLAELGGNSFRTWGVGADTQKDLDEAQRLGLAVTVGIWLGHDAAGIRNGIAKNKEAIMKYKDHPALLCWSLGNEMESEGHDKPELWQAIEELAKMVKQTDPNHPTMTVIAELGGNKLNNIKQYCPSIDIVGINSYGGGPSVGERFKKANIGKPYVITEYGPPGTWEMGRNSFGAAPELTSAEKAASYRDIYQKSVAGEPGVCLGSYAFTWGFKREATATWYGLFLPDNSKLAAVDTLAELWSGKPPAKKCPTISKIALAGPDQVNPGDTIKASVTTSDPQGGKLEINWALVKEMSNYNVNGTGSAATEDFSSGIKQNGQPSVEMKLPTAPGVYRLFCYIHNPFNSAAIASLPIKIK